MLDHPDTYNLVEPPRLIQIAIIEQPSFATIGQPFFRNARLCPFQLLVAERDAKRPHAIFTDGKTNQPSPSAADVEQALALLQSQLAADAIELSDLRSFDVLIRLLEVPSRI